MDLILRNALLAGQFEGRRVDVGIDGGRIAVIAPDLVAEGPEIDVHNRLVSPGFVETHIHLDKSCIMERCTAERGDLQEAIEQVAVAKKEFTAEDVAQRGSRRLEKSILQGTTHMRTHVEVDPGIGLKGLDGLLPLVRAYKWAVDLEICVFPQEGLTNNPGTDGLMVEALKRGARVVGAAPYTDTDPRAQIDRVFEMARQFDVDIDVHLDFGDTADTLDVDYVCDQTERFGYGGRVTVGHMTKLSATPVARFESVARRMAGAGVAVTVLPSTDLYLMARDQEHSVIRGVTAAHRLLRSGVNCSISSNNILNPFTPFGDCSLIRMSNLYANVCQVGKRDEIQECFEMVTHRSARLLRLRDYGIAVGNWADLVVLDCADPVSAVAELAVPLYGFKRGRRTFTREPAELHSPE